MKTILFMLFILLGINRVFSQDTIRFLNNTIKVVKVTEINVDDIKYKRFDNLEGPLYVSSKSEIESIKFSNGLVETFKPSENKPQTVVSATISTSSNSTNQNTSFEKIVIIDKNKLMHFGKPMGESRLLRVINNYPESEKKTLMMKEYSNMKSFKKKQYLFGFIGLGAGVGLAYFGMMASIISADSTPIAVGLAGGVSIGVTGAVIAHINKQKRLKKKIEIATIYNN